MKPQESYCSIPMPVADGVFTRFFSQKSLNTNATIEKADSGDSAYQTSCSFTGKEKDSETGYSYFGARYLEHELMTGWLSVDPMSDKYPSISPYNYCHWNPLKLIDADGKEDYEVNRMGYITKCKDQSHAVEGQDRLFAKPLIGHVRFDKNGNTKSAFVSVKEGVLSRYEEGPIGRQENRGMMYDNSIIYNGYYVFKNRRIEKLPWER